MKAGNLTCLHFRCIQATDMTICVVVKQQRYTRYWIRPTNNTPTFRHINCRIEMHVHCSTNARTFRNTILCITSLVSSTSAPHTCTMDGNLKRRLMYFIHVCSINFLDLQNQGIFINTLITKLKVK